MSRHEHWEKVYRARPPNELSWYSPHLADSTRLIRDAASSEASIIDVGGGASTLVDDLLRGGFSRLTVLDISESAISHTRTRLADDARRVTWIQADITSADLPPDAFDVWHDRAVFHFLTAEPDRRAYVQALRRSLRSGGHVVISTFSLSGPEKCSGLDVVRYDVPALERELGSDFALSVAEEPVHVTPGGKAQHFLLCRFARRASNRPMR